MLGLGFELTFSSILAAPVIEVLAKVLANLQRHCITSHGSRRKGPRPISFRLATIIRVGSYSRFDDRGFRWRSSRLCCRDGGCQNGVVKIVDIETISTSAVFGQIPIALHTAAAQTVSSRRSHGPAVCKGVSTPTLAGVLAACQDITCCLTG